MYPVPTSITANLRRLFGTAAEHGIPVVSTADYHTPDDPEFADFPPHCVRGTHGQHRLPDTLLPNRAVLDIDETVSDMADLLDRHGQVILNKQTIDIWQTASTRQVRDEIQADRWYVFGVATDYCIKSAAIGLANAGKRTYVVADAIKAITPEGEAQAIEEMKQAGVSFVTTDEVVQAVSTRKNVE